jgi:hypothetical protein
MPAREGRSNGVVMNRVHCNQISVSEAIISDRERVGANDAFVRVRPRRCPHAQVIVSTCTRTLETPLSVHRNVIRAIHVIAQFDWAINDIL